MKKNLHDFFFYIALLLVLLQHKFSLLVFCELIGNNEDRLSSSQWHVDSQLRSQRIADENALTGSTDWWRPILPSSVPGAEEHNRLLDLQAMSLEGFSTSFSIFPKQKLGFKVDYTFLSSDGSQSIAYTFELRIYRIGYYGGRGAREVAIVPMRIPLTEHSHVRHSFLQADSILRKHSQPPCGYQEETHTVECSNWDINAEWTAPSETVSGVYVAVPRAIPRSASGGARKELIGQYIPFVVSSPQGTGSALLVKTSDLTWVAYNKYGGYNMYEAPGNSSEANVPNEDVHNFQGRSRVSSYDRPWHNRLSFPRGQPANFVLHTEFPLIYWLEKHSYDVSYASCEDFERRFGSIEGSTSAAVLHRVFVSSGHDEYWTAKLRAVWTSARDTGVSLAFFSGNEIFWRVKWDTTVSEGFNNKQTEENEEQKHAPEHRRVVCQKESSSLLNVEKFSNWTGTFMDPRQPGFDHSAIATPQNALTGQLFMVNAYRNDPLDIPAEFSQLRFWRHTPDVSKLRHSKGNSQKVKTAYRTSGGLLGYEWDAQSYDRFRPLGLVPLSRTRVDINGQLLQENGAGYGGSGPMRHSITMYRQQQRGSIVFSTGTCQWAWALCALHDYTWNIAHVPTDVNLQQATLNIFADMGILPWHSADVTIRAGQVVNAPWNAYYNNAKNESALLTATFPPSDRLPPHSKILWPEASIRLRLRPRAVSVETGDPWGLRQGSTESAPVVARHATVRMRGTAEDVGGGIVALVEVSVDGGRTWGVAHGRDGKWNFPITFHFLCAESNNDGPDTQASGQESFPVYYSTAGEQIDPLMYVTYHEGLPRYNMDVCNPRGRAVGRDWTEMIAVRSRATDDSGWSEPIQQSSKHEVQLICRISTSARKL